jgi:oligopeptide transport system ATP-binding protein
MPDNGSGKGVLLDVQGLKLYYTGKSKGLLPGSGHYQVKAVDGISLRCQRGETFGLVGESGCGKSSAAFAILQLYKPTAGQVIFEGQDLCALDEEALRPLRQRMQIIFQNPYSSLDPRMTIGRAIGEPLQIHGIGDAKSRQVRVQELLDLVGLEPYFQNRYPHEFSGGQQQRIGIARALASSPSFIVADEPISSTDVSIQAQIINLLEDLQERFNLTYLFISHDLRVVYHICDTVGVMYLGTMVEQAVTDELYDNPAHPYTQALLSAVPIPNARREDRRKRQVLSGEVPSPLNPPAGCRFHTRCPVVMSQCRSVPPEYKQISSAHWVACHLY